MIVLAQMADWWDVTPSYWLRHETTPLQQLTIDYEAWRAAVGEAAVINEQAKANLQNKLEMIRRGFG